MSDESVDPILLDQTNAIRDELGLEPLTAGLLGKFKEELHKRAGKGTEEGGQFIEMPGKRGGFIDVDSSGRGTGWDSWDSPSSRSDSDWGWDQPSTPTSSADDWLEPDTGWDIPETGPAQPVALDKPKLKDRLSKLGGERREKKRQERAQAQSAQWQREYEAKQWADQDRKYKHWRQDTGPTRTPTGWNDPGDLPVTGEDHRGNYTSPSTRAGIERHPNDPGVRRAKELREAYKYAYDSQRKAQIENAIMDEDGKDLFVGPNGRRRADQVADMLVEIRDLEADYAAAQRGDAEVLRRMGSKEAAYQRLSSARAVVGQFREKWKKQDAEEAEKYRKQQEAREKAEKAAREAKRSQPSWY